MGQTDRKEPITYGGYGGMLHENKQQHAKKSTKKLMNAC